MGGFHIHSGNQLESLAEVLAGLLSEKRSVGVLEPEIVVVPSRGLARWLKFDLARVNGVSANLEFPFPQAFLEQNVFAGLRRQVDPQIAGDPFTKEMLVWKIFFALEKGADGGSAGGARFSEIDNYLKLTGDELSRYQLASELGDLFDRYLLFRPELIRAWERGENPLHQFRAAKWQMDLWRELGQGLAKTHFAALQEVINQMVYPEFFPEPSSFSLPSLKAKLPQRLFLFGFATLPFNYLDLFKALSRLIEVHLFHVNPCAEFWGDQFSFSGKKQSLKDTTGGHPLLASWGRPGRAFFDLSASLEVDSYSEYFVAPQADTLLARLQRQILRLQPPAKVLICAPQESSLKIHLCHGRQREIEILYDTILDALAKDSELKPDDIFVMAPDIGLYSPYVEALFARQRSAPESLRLDYAIISPKSMFNLPEIKALFDLLRLLRSRFLLSEVFDLFSQEVVRRRFSVSESGLGLLSEWLQRAAISWGLDGSFREDVTSVDFAENSILWGLERLLAGYGLAGSELDDSDSVAVPIWSDESGADFLPLAGIEGSEALVLGSFVDFIATLRQAYERLLQPLPAAEWRSELERLLNDFILPQPDQDSGRQRLRQAFEKLDKYLGSVTKSGFNNKSESEINDHAAGTVSCEVMLVALERELQDIGGDSGFFTGGITFSSILPLRSVPTQMICLLGLNDGEFPRNQRPSAYDLVAARPRAGDRNPRDEDRYLFLETLLAARKTLVLSYLGRDPKDNHLRPPAVVVSELIDYIEEYFVPPPESGCESMRDFLLFDHPPQPFSSCYFQAQNSETALRVNPLFSYDVLQSRIATEINARGKKREVFSDAVLEPKPCNRIKISDLLRFFSNPAKFFLRERLKVNPGIKELDRFDDSEPFALDGLASYKFNDELVSHFMANSGDEGDCKVDISSLEKRFAASGTLPPRTPGRVIFADKVQGAQALAAQLKPYCDKPLPGLQKEVVVRLSGGEVVVEIDLHNLFLGEDDIPRQMLYRPAQDVKDKDRVKSAIMNLALEIVSPSQTELNDGINDLLEPVETRFHTLKVKGVLVLPVRDAESGRTDLEILLEYYLAGFERPLSFLPELSLQWYKTWLKESAKNGDAAGYAKAREKVVAELNNERNYGAQDEAYRFLFADDFEDEDFWLDFADKARRLGPILMCSAGK